MGERQGKREREGEGKQGKEGARVLGRASEEGNIRLFSILYIGI